MSLIEVFKHAWHKAQQKEFCHKKLMKLVENAVDKSKLEEFLKLYKQALFGCYYNDCADKNPYSARGLEFLAKIAMKITLGCVQPIGITNPNGITSHVYDITLDPFFTNVLKASLKFSDTDKSEVRFNTCYFISTLLQNIGNNVEMDYSICNIILDSLVPLLHDPKANVRLQAIKALVRLQEPSNADCIVLKSFLILSTDPNSEVRKTIISHIAPHPQSYIKVRLRTTDIDLSVRQAAYMKFADINPKLCLKIIDRNIILNNGLSDQNKKIKHIMSETLLPKWLNSFEGNYLHFLRALRLDADENDINNFEKLCTEVLDIFLRKNSLTDVLKYLPVDKEDKLIPIQQLRLESVFYWSNLINYLRNVEDGEEYLVNILPEMTAFSNYIERIIKEKSPVTMDEWENLEYQTIIFQLFKITSGFDMSDEVGRKTLYALILKILTNNKFHQKVIDKILQVAAQLNSDVGSLTIDLCQIISEIREPLMNEMPSEDKLRKRNFEVTQLKVKIHQLEINEEEALKKKDFQLAHIVQNEVKECQRMLDNLKNMYNVSEKVRVCRDDPETLCRCLDILIGLLKIPHITIMCSALRSCRDEFLMPLLSNNSSEILWRFILCLGLFSLMDRDLAFKHINFLCLPIATYRVVPNCDKLALKTSIACVTDVIRVFGVKVIGMEENSQSELNQEGNHPTSRRKLYSEDLSQPEVLNKDDITIEFIIDIIVDMLDDEDEGVRQTASNSIKRLIVHNFPVSPELICRLILKWYNPETEKQDIGMNIQLGTIIECFANRTKGSRRVVQKAIFPIISSVVNASGTSPLLEVDIENVLKFLAALTNDETETIHDEIALNLIEKMLNKPNDACSPYLIKLLTYLEPSFKDLDICKNIIDSTELLLGDVVDKIPKKYLLKFRDKFTSGLRNASVLVHGDQSEIHVTNGTEGNIEDQSSLIRKSLVNGEMTTENHEPLGDIDASDKESEGNQKGNSSSSDSDSEGDIVESNSIPHSKGSDSAIGSEKRSIIDNDEGKIFKGKTKLQRITEEKGQETESSISINCEKMTNNEKEIEGFFTENDASVDQKKDGKNDNTVCVKYDYTPEKNSEKFKKPKQPPNHLEYIKKRSSGSDHIQNTSQVKVLATTTENLETGKPSEGSSRSIRSKKNSKDDSQVKLQKTTGKNMKMDKLREGSSRSTRSNANSRNDNVNIISEVIIQKKGKQELEGNKTAESSSLTSRTKNSYKKTDSQVELKKKTKTKLETGKLSEESPRPTRSNTNTNTNKVSQIILEKTTRKKFESNNPSEGSSRITRSNQNSRNHNIQILAKTNERDSGEGKLLEVSPLSTRSNKTKNKKDSNYIISPKRKLQNRQTRHNKETSSCSTDTDDEKESSPYKKSKRKTSTPSKFKDYITCPVTKQENQLMTSPKQKQVEKRTANTPLSTIVNRKSKRLSKSSIEEKQATPNKSNNPLETRNRQTPLFSGGMGSLRRFSKSVATNSSVKRMKKSRPSFVVKPKKKSWRNTPKISRTYPKRLIQTPNSSIKKNTNEIQTTKKPQEQPSSTKEKEDEQFSSDDSDSVFKKPRRKNSKDKMNSNKKTKSDSNQRTDGVLQSLNSVMNEINNTSINRRSSRLSDKNMNESSSTNKHSSKTKGKKRLQQESTHSSTLTRSRTSDQLNVSNCASRKKLDFSSFSDETILKTFLQADEEFQVLENMSIEDVHSSSNTSHDSKKENISSTSSSSRRSSRRKRNNSSSPEAPPKKKMMGTKKKKNLKRVSK